MLCLCIVCQKIGNLETYESNKLEIRFLSFRLSSRKNTYIIDHLKPHFYIVKLGFAGVYIIFIIFLKKNVGIR